MSWLLTYVDGVSLRVYRSLSWTISRLLRAQARGSKAVESQKLSTAAGSCVRLLRKPR